MRSIRTSRRAVMCALAVTPIAIAPAVKAMQKNGINDPVSSMTKADSAAWDAAMGQFEAAQRSEDAYLADDRTTWTSSNEREIERLIDIRCDAEDRLTHTPAPAVSAVVWKIEYARKRWVDFTDWPDDWWASVMTDLHRMAGEAVA